MMRILLAESEAQSAEALGLILKKDGYLVDVAFDGTLALCKLEQERYDFILLDIPLSEVDGFFVLQNIREKMNPVPVLAITEKNDVSGRVRYLNLGADDCLSKPYETDELLARIKAVMRRGNRLKKAEDLTNIWFGDISLCPANRTMRRGEQEMKLSAKEYELLRLLFQNQDTVLSKKIIFDQIWAQQDLGDYNAVEVFVSFLRRKLNAISAGIVIKTIRGTGYKICLKR